MLSRYRLLIAADSFGVRVGSGTESSSTMAHPPKPMSPSAAKTALILTRPRPSSTKRYAHFGLRRHRTLDVLDVEKQQSVAVPPNRGHRVAAALLVVRDVEQQLHVPRICRRQHAIRVLRALADRPHVRVIPDRDAQFRRAPPDLRQHVAKSGAVVRRDGASRGPFVGELQILSAGVGRETARSPRARRSRAAGAPDRCRRCRSRARRTSVRGRAAARAASVARFPKRRKNVRSELDAAEAERGDVVDGVEVFAAPRDGGVADLGAPARRWTKARAGQERARGRRPT